MKNEIRKLCEGYALRIWELEDVIPNLDDLCDHIGSAEAEGEMLCLMNVVRELGKLIEEPHKDKILTMEEMEEISYDADYDLIFVEKGVKYRFLYEAYDYLTDEYGVESVREGMGNVKNMIANGLYEIVKD